MKLGRLAMFAVTTIGTAMGSAAAQGVLQPSQRPGEPPCFSDFSPLRNEAEKRAKAIQAAGKRKVAPQEMCELFKRFSAAEEKAVKYAVNNATWCGIPAQAVKQMEANHAKTIKVRNQICTAAAAPRAHTPSLGDALGTTPVPSASTTRTGHGTYDSLTGNPLAR